MMARSSSAAWAGAYDDDAEAEYGRIYCDERTVGSRVAPEE